MLILAIDLGTTGNRAILFNEAAEIVANCYREFRQIYPRPGWVEHDPIEIWETTQAVTREAIAQVDRKEIVALGITNQRETIVCWDPATGLPLNNAIVWQDRRTADQCDALKREGWEAEIRRRTGLPCDPYFSATKIEWLLEHVPASRNAHFGTIDSWILWKLTGGRTFATDITNASRTMLCNLEERDWDDWLLELFGVSRDRLPRIMPSSGELGQVDGELFGGPIPILGLAGDQQASMFAQGCYQPGTVKNTYGTGLFLMQNTGDRPRLSERLVSTVAWTVGGRTEYALEGSVFIGGAAVQWLRDGLGIITSAAETGAMAAGLASTGDVYFVPALAGLGAPYWDPRARGLLVGLTRSTTSAHIVRAALESMAYQTKDVSDAMAAELGTPLRLLQVDGGACGNDWLMQFQADILGVPVERPVVAETTALGAAGLAGLAAGVWGGREEFLSHRKVERTFSPRMSGDERESLHARWKEAVARSRDWAV